MVNNVTSEVYVGEAISTHLAHASHRDAAEGPEHVGLDTRRRLKHKDTTSTKQIHWDLTGKHSRMTYVEWKRIGTLELEVRLNSCAVTQVFNAKILKFL